MKKLKLKPFFTETEMKAVKESASEDRDCLECGLFRKVKSPKMPITGEGKLDVLLLGESPGKTEDEQNTQFVGDAGDFLRERLKDRGLDLDRDFLKTNCLRCRPFTSKGRYEKNRPPTRKELKLCRQHYLDFIQEKKPRFIWLVGKNAVESYYMDRFSDEEGTDLTIARWRGLCIPDALSNAWIIPIYHPSYAMRYEHDPLITSQFDRDLDFAISCLKREPPTFFNPYDKVKILKDYDEVMDLLEDILENPPDLFVFDYETTGLKPFNKGHKIVSVSYCCSEDVSYSFPMEHPCFGNLQQKQIKKLWSKILRLKAKKVAQGVKFEETWSQQILGVTTRNWHHCTMNASHILDNRKSFTGLKFQAFIRWGIEDYDKTMRPYLRSKGEFNRILEAPLDDLLLYGGIDGLLEFKLFKEQEKEMTKRQKETLDFFMDGLVALADIQMNGICADKAFYENADEEIESKMFEIVKGLISSDEALLFKEKIGHELSLTSDQDLRKLFFDVLKLPPGKETEKGSFSVDASVLKELDSDFARKLTEFNKLDKVKGTYIGQILREIDDDGKLRPFFDLHKVSSFRSSSSKLNWQNLPIRNKDAKYYTRTGIKPSPGNILLDFDFSGAEVRIAAIVSNDPVLKAYINDPASDMHRDLCMDLLLLKASQVTKDLRFHAKNSFTFAQFYGSYYVSCATALWELFVNEDDLMTKQDEFDGDRFSGEKDIHILDHLYNVGIGDYEAFEKHVKKVEAKFWKKYHVFREWQNSMMKFYEQKGYIELLTGFRCSGYMTKNQIFNLPIQGPAFHCLLYALIDIHNALLNRRLTTKIIGQIHDNLIFDCNPSEKKEVMELSNDIVHNQIGKDWTWISVPLEIGWAESKIDGNWAEMEELK